MRFQSTTSPTSNPRWASDPLIGKNPSIYSNETPPENNISHVFLYVNSFKHSCNVFSNTSKSPVKLGSVFDRLSLSARSNIFGSPLPPKNKVFTGTPSSTKL